MVDEIGREVIGRKKDGLPEERTKASEQTIK